MAIEPSEDAVQSFCGLSGLPRSNALRWLKAHGNDANNAAIAWMDGGQADLPPPPRNDNTYDEQLWHTDRDGNAPKTQMEASGLVDRVPPTRPSSRVDSMKPIYGPENNPSISQPSSYERDLQRAKEMSLSESQTLSAQETGVTCDGQYFGPPTQATYANEKWAMTVPETNTQEILLNPEPPDRRRAPGAPAFLKPTSISDSLAPFLAILHSIPLAREALLSRSNLINDYGRNPEWWDGTPIRALRVVNIDEHGHEAQSEDLLHETQRLMAFLDDTERAYGNSDALIGQPTFERSADGIINAFLVSWRMASESSSADSTLAKMFTSRGIVRPRISDVPGIDQDIQALSLEIRDPSSLYKEYSLYELIDEFIARNSDEADTFLEELGEVFTFDITNFNAGKSQAIKIPPIWYADRYLESSLELLSQIQAAREDARKLTHILEDRAGLLSLFQKPGSSSSLDVGLLMKVVMKHFETKMANAESAKSPEQKVKLQTVLDQMTQLFEQVLSQLKKISDTQDGIPEQLLQISNELKGPSENQNLSPSHRYVLKGVILRSSSFYVLKPYETTEEGASSSLSPSVPNHQWWRIEYNTTSLNPVVTTKVTEKEVLDAASTDSRNVYLVYASDKALAHENDPLPTQLQNFVKADNRTFQAELEAHQTQKDEEMSWERSGQDWSNPQQTWENSPPRQANWPETSGGGFPAALSPQKRKAKEAADEDSDMEVEHDEHSPAMMPSDGEDEGEFISSDSSPLDPYPFEQAFGRYEAASNPPMQQRLRPLEPKPAIAAAAAASAPAMGLNGRLPVTLRQEESSGDQEMEEIKR